MRIAEIQPDRAYRSARGAVRTVVAFTDHRQRRGAQDGVRYRAANGREYVCSTAWFARWSVSEVTPETPATEAQP